MTVPISPEPGQPPLPIPTEATAPQAPECGRPTHPVNKQQRRPVKRAFMGLAGSPLAKAQPFRQPRRLVLLHFCFDQQSGESKQKSCTCKQRVPLEKAIEYVQQGRADWLLVRNPKTNKLVKFRRAVVVCRVAIDEEILFAVHNEKIDLRDKKHEQIRAKVRLEARKILQELFSKGLVPPLVVKMNDTQLDSLLSDAKASGDFLKTLSPLFHKKWVEVMKHWWNNVLGYYRLNAGAGLFMPDADSGVGKITFVGSAQEVGLVDDHHQTDTGRVVGANFRPHFWNGGWLFSVGAGPDSYEEDGHNDQEPDSEIVSEEQIAPEYDREPES